MARCDGEDPELFFRPEGRTGQRLADERWMEAEAKKVCGTCLVQAECLAAAVLEDDRHAIRGGLTYEDRLAAGVQQRPMERTYESNRWRPGERHGDIAGYRRHQRAGTPVCDECREGRNRHDRERGYNKRQELEQEETA